MTPCLSVLVPAYEMHGFGAIFLRRCLESVLVQDVNHVVFDGVVQIVVSDESDDDTLLDVCRDLTVSPGFQLLHVRESSARRSASTNLNAAFGASSGRIIKILFQDDFLVSRHALLETLKALEAHPAKSWLLCGTTHTRDGETFFGDMVPRLHDRIHLGSNTVSSPSVLALRRSAWIPFDTRLRWLMDVDVYKSLLTAYGPPVILESIVVANALGEHQVTARGITPTALLVEKARVARRHGPGLTSVLAVEILEFPSALARRAAIWLRKRLEKRMNRSLSYFVHPVRFFHSLPRTPEPSQVLSRAEVINRVVASIGAERYLEIGVNTKAQPGYSRDKIRVDVKHGVDPNPLTDADFIMTSDEFFATNSETYDVVFIDGLHLFEQALRDCLHSLDVLNPRGVVILHDTRPSNRLSASRVPGKDPKWHGDVWRAVVILRALRPSLSVHTLDSDEGLTLVRALGENDASDRLLNLSDEPFSWNYYVSEYRKLLSVIDTRQFLAAFPLDES